MDNPTMIARFRALLPYAIHIHADIHEPQNASFMGERFVVYPPFVSRFKDRGLGIQIPFNEVRDQLSPADDLDAAVSIDGIPARRANALQIDLIRPDFNRTRSTPEVSVDDPPEALFFSVANEFLSKLRSKLQSEFIKPVLMGDVPSLIEYLRCLAPLPTLTFCKNTSLV